MVDTPDSMTRTAAAALLSALLLFASSCANCLNEFISGWQFAISPPAFVLPAIATELVGLLGATLFGLALIAQTLMRRAYWRHLAVFAAIIALWIGTHALASPFFSGMAWSLWRYGIDERTLVGFAVAARSFAAAEPRSRPSLGENKLQTLRGSHGRIFETLPEHAYLQFNDDSVEIIWGNGMVGQYGLRVFDRAMPPATIADAPYATYSDLFPRVQLVERHF